MDLSKIKPAETKEVDISKFLDGEKAKVVIRHYSVWEKQEIDVMPLNGQKVDQKTGTIQLQNKEVWEQVVIKKLLAGVEKAPFDWNEETIKQINKINPQLIEYIYWEVEKFNTPLQ